MSSRNINSVRISSNNLNRMADFSFVNEGSRYPYARYEAQRDKRRKEKRRAKRVRLFIKIVLLIPLVILTAILFFGNSANGQDDIRESKTDYYREMESRYMEVLRSELGRKGMGSAGVTLTSVIDINGDRSYNVVLHHEKISKMDEEEKQAFLDDMDGISFADNSVLVEYEILN